MGSILILTYGMSGIGNGDFVSDYVVGFMQLKVCKPRKMVR